MEHQGDFGLDINPIRKVEAPRVEEKVPEIIERATIKALLTTCGDDFAGRRDRAVMSLMWDSGARRGEIASMTMSSVGHDRNGDLVFIASGKTGTKHFPFTPDTRLLLDKYERLRDRHPHSISEMYWLGERGPLKERGIYQMITKKAKRLGLPHTYPHMFRCSRVDRSLGDGIQERIVVNLMGWAPESRSMLDRYARSRNHERAMDPYRSRYY